MASIPQIIATINPDLYYDFKDDEKNLSKFKDLIKTTGFNVAASQARPKALKFSFSNQIASFDPKKGGIEAKHTLTYDSSTETLEPIYFFILDLLKEFGMDVEKLIDNFSSSPGSGHFGELGQRLSIMQQQGTKLMGDINTVVRSILNLIYDLKEFKIRLQYYDDLNSSDERIRNAAKLSLKQIWMDKVDSQKGNSGLKVMASTQVGFITAIDAFLVANSLKEANDLDLNDRVKRLVIGRIAEFELWLKESGMELKKRYELEKTYLKSQVNSLKLYTRWAKPYLKAAQELEQKEQGTNPDFVKTFNTILLELTLMGKSSVNPVELPPEVRKVMGNRKYYSCYFIDFNFRGIPQRVSGQGHYAFGGKADVTFSAYALNEDEIAALKEKLDESDVADGLRLIEGMTTESLSQLQEDIDYFLNEKSENEKSKDEKKNSEDVNPFLALIGFYNKPKEKKEEKKQSKKSAFPIRKDDWLESTHLRKRAAENAKETLFALFDVYKKAHGMVSFT